MISIKNHDLKNGRFTKNPPGYKEIREAASQESPKISKKDMDKHRNKLSAEKATKDEQERQDRYAANQRKKGKECPHSIVRPKSYFTEDADWVLVYALKAIREGRCYTYKANDGSTHIQVDFGRPIGKCYDENHKPIDSNSITAVYSRSKGFHCYPDEVEPRRKEASEDDS